MEGVYTAVEILNKVPKSFFYTKAGSYFELSNFRKYLDLFESRRAYIGQSETFSSVILDINKYVFRFFNELITSPQDLINFQQNGYGYFLITFDDRIE